MPRLTLDEYVEGVRARDRAVLGRAVTLLESRHGDDRELARELLQALLPHTGQAHRVGITGVPGVGKSTFIDALGTRLLDQGHRLAVLAVDPTSVRTGGSILGDKTRMGELAQREDAFIRPSPSAGTLGGVAATTRETMLLCEAAGYDLVFVETVGVGQSEVTVSEMVDVFVLLALPGAGDELQGIKKGVLELADIVAVNKADIDERATAQAVRHLDNALRIVRGHDPEWQPKVTTCSARTGDGLDALWELIEEHRRTVTASGAFAQRRQRQRVRWLWSLVEDRLLERFRTDSAERIAEVERRVASGELAPTVAADDLLARHPPIV